MRRLPKVRAVISCLLTLSASSLFADAPALITPDHAETIYRQLVEYHWIPKTGLFRSFPDSSDLKLSQQASTYEQAAMGLLALRFGDRERAEGLYEFFKKTWNAGPQDPGRQKSGDRGLVNFYNAHFGSEGIEKTIHMGPNAWIGLFAARYANTTRDRQALQLALDIQYWMAMVLPHDRGGVAMGLRNDPYGASWSKIYSTENNLSYYAFLTELLRSPVIDKAKRVAITEERDQVEHWIVNVAYDPQTKTMLRGINPSGRDTIRALDTTTWLISAIGPKRLKERGIDPYLMMKKAESEFEVMINGLRGVDPTDQAEADRVYVELRSQMEDINRPGDNGHRVSWYEGLGQYILAWSLLAEDSARDKDHIKAAECARKAETLTKEFDRAALKRFDGARSYAYATPGKFFRYGWGAPREADEGPAASLITGVWRCFAGLNYDPLYGQSMKTAPTVRVSLPKEFKLVPSKQVVLYGTSEDMTTEAWRALANEDWQHAILQARATIEEWSSAAKHLQKMKDHDEGRVVEYSGKADEKLRVFKYWALNDVAASYFILGKALDHLQDYTGASRAFSQIVTHYSLAQIWDPRGWFWSPVQAITEDYVLADRKNYGWVIPQIYAEGSRTGKTPF